MVKFLIKRPVAVSMTFIALVILGLVSTRFIPVSLLPDIDIPQVTVKLNCPDVGAREVEEVYVNRIRRSLQQAGHLDNIKSAASNGKATLVLKFKYGTNINYAYLEVNEKIDGLMAYMPDGFERPKVIKAKASDIPSFYVNVSLNSKVNNDSERFMELSAFTESIIKKRIEQLPEVALVDITGMEYPEIYIQLKQSVSEQLGISEKQISDVLKANNISIGNIQVKDGMYEYNLRYSSNLIDRTDLEELLVTSGHRVFQLKDLAEIGVRNQLNRGQFMANNQKALCLAVIKKGDVQMSDLDDSFNTLLTEIQKDYPRLNIEVTRDQTQLLKISVNNLRSTLIIGGMMAFLVMFLFLKNPKAPWLIGLTIPVSLIISVLVFYLSGLSINIISLSGLILGVGMMIDNSIIVIDNITQHVALKQKNGTCSIIEACVEGTNEVIGPLISSALTTCAVFLPLIFLSGMAGELFFDQAIAVSVGLGVSLLVSISLLPVYYKLLHNAPDKITTPKKRRIKLDIFSNIEPLYHVGYKLMFKNKGIFVLLLLVLSFSGGYLFYTAPKEAFPTFEETEVFAIIDWGENIHSTENAARVNRVMQSTAFNNRPHNSFVGIQQFVMMHMPEVEITEAILYFDAESSSELLDFKTAIETSLKQQYPKAILKFDAPPTVFQQIFTNSEAPLVVNLVSGKQQSIVSVDDSRAISRKLSHQLNTHFQKLPMQYFYQIKPKTEVLTRYDISPYSLYSRLRQALTGFQVSELKTGHTYTPIVLTDEEKSLEEVLATLQIAGKDRTLYPVHQLVDVVRSADYKVITGGKEGAFISLIPNLKNEDVPDAIENIKKNWLTKSKLTYFLSGSYFRNNQLFSEMMVVLAISVLLLYFILAAQFESLVQPIIVLLEIPIDIAGAMLVLKLGGASVNIMSLIGIVVMTGIIINDSILKIDTINRLRAKGMELNAAITEAGYRRLKPILMTSITTILALVPFLFGNSMGNVLQRPLALAIIGGMGIGTMVSLYFIPLMYWALYRKKG